VPPAADDRATTSARTADGTPTEGRRTRERSGDASPGGGGVDPLAEARAYLLAVRRGGDPTPHADRLASLAPGRLRTALGDDDARRAFWLNVYNAGAHHRLRADPSLYDRRTRFFRRDLLTVAGHDLSLDDVEHGLLRRSLTAWGLGYVPRLRPDAFERTHRVAERDPRVHFALNCGAASCPPIAAYEADRVDEQLRLATESYLEMEVTYDAATNLVRVPRLFLWFPGDFGGRSGTRAFLRAHGAVPADAGRVRLRYRSYDWSLSLDAFVDGDRVASTGEEGGEA
jgi:hypothetical protein